MPIFPIVFAMLLLSPLASEPGTVSDQPLLLDVYLNGRNIGRVGEFVLRGTDLLATRDELRSLGFRVPAAGLTDRATGAGDPNAVLLTLGTLAGVTWRIDTENQAIYFVAPVERLLVSRVGDEDAGRSAGRDMPESSIGLTMNFDLNAMVSGGTGGVSAALDVRQYSTLGVFTSGFLLYDGGIVQGRKLVRLDSNYTRVDVKSMRRYVAGDFVTGSLSWSRPVRLEGVQVRSDFSTRPDLITFPLPSISGSVAVPSAVQVFTGTGQVASSQVALGPFEIPQVPTTTGAGTIVMTVTDATGQQVRTTQPFYSSPALLRPGLQSYSLEFGKTRLNWGLRSEDFGTYAGSATYRRGITSAFTVEATAQGAPGATMAGGGGVARLGTFGTVSAAAAGSFGSGGTGGQFVLDVARQGRFFTFEATGLTATANFRDIASINGDTTLRTQATVSASISSARRGAVGLLFALVRKDVPASSQLIIAPVGVRARTLAVTYSRQLHDISVYLNGYGDLTERTSGVLAGVVIPLRRRASVNLGVTTGGSAPTAGQILLTKSASDIGEWGYQVYANAGGLQHQFAEIEHRVQRGFVSAGIDATSGVTSLRATSSGAVSVVDRGVFLSNRIQDSFAIVDTSGLADVRVLDEERVVARSDRHGRAMVPDLRSFQANHLAIDTSDVPLDISFQDSARVVRPQDRSAVVVHFRAADTRSALLTFVDNAGSFIPVGSVARLLPGGESVAVGYDGAAYLQELSQSNQVRVVYPDGSACTANFRYVHLPGTIPTIGPVSCL